MSCEFLNHHGYSVPNQDLGSTITNYCKYYWMGRYVFDRHQYVTLQYIRGEVGHTTFINSIAKNFRIWRPAQFTKFVEGATLKAYPEIEPMWNLAAENR